MRAANHAANERQRQEKAERKKKQARWQQKRDCGEDTDTTDEDGDNEGIEEVVAYLDLSRGSGDGTVILHSAAEWENVTAVADPTPPPEGGVPPPQRWHS